MIRQKKYHKYFICRLLYQSYKFVGIVSYEISTGGFVSILVEILDRDGAVVGSSSKVQDVITIVNAHFWWPYTMTNLIPGYQYTLKVGTPVYI